MATDVYAYGKRSDRNPAAGAAPALTEQMIRTSMRDPRRRRMMITRLRVRARMGWEAKLDKEGKIWYDTAGRENGRGARAGDPRSFDRTRMLIRRMTQTKTKTTAMLCPCGNHRLSSRPCYFGVDAAGAGGNAISVQKTEG